MRANSRMYHAEQGIEWIPPLVTIFLGAALSVFAPSWIDLIIGEILLGFLLNLALLMRSAIATGHAHNILLAIVGAIPAGIIESVNTLCVGIAARWSSELVAQSGVMGTYLLLQVVFLLVVFVLSLNEYLRGASKERINGVLLLLAVGLVVVAFLAFGWKAAAAALLLGWVYIGSFPPVAVRIAAWILAKVRGEPGAARHVGLPPAQLMMISNELARGLESGWDLATALADLDRLAAAERALLSYCESNEDIREVMEEFNISSGELKELYDTLLVVGAGQWAGGHFVAASAIAYPETLRFLLAHRDDSEAGWVEVVARVIHYFETGLPPRIG